MTIASDVEIIARCRCPCHVHGVVVVVVVSMQNRVVVVVVVVYKGIDAGSGIYLYEGEISSAM
jgi:hypothetical protein